MGRGGGPVRVVKLEPELVATLVEDLRVWLDAALAVGAYVEVREQADAFTVIARSEGWKPTRVSHTARLLEDRDLRARIGPPPPVKARGIPEGGQKIGDIG